MNPYFEIEYCNKNYKSVVDKDGGKFPKWNQVGGILLLILTLKSFEFELLNLNEDIKFTVWDENTIASNDFVSVKVSSSFFLVDRAMLYQGDLSCHEQRGQRLGKSIHNRS